MGNGKSSLTMNSSKQKIQFATIYEQDLEFISRCILDYPDVETGGDLFGFWNNLWLPVILYVSGPGKNCYRDSGFFKQDIDFLIGIGNHLYDNFGLQHIGSWHSHHKLSLAVPSLHDSSTMVKAINKNGLKKFFMILGNITKEGGTAVNGFLYDSENQTNYSETSWRVLNSENVISKAINASLEKELYYQPQTKSPRLQDLKLSPRVEKGLLTLCFEPESWLASEKGKQELKAVFDWFQSKFENAKMFLSRNEYLELKADTISIVFKHNFPDSFPEIELEGNLLIQEEGKLDFENGVDIIEFIESKIHSIINL